MARKGSVLLDTCLVLVSYLILCVQSDTAKGDFLFEEPVNVGSQLNTSGDEGIDCISYGGLEAYLTVHSGGYKLAVSKRSSVDEEWGPWVLLSPTINGKFSNEAASITSDGSELYYTQFTAPGQGGDLVVSRRASSSDPWGPPEDLGPVLNGSNILNGQSWIMGSGLEYYIPSIRPGGLGSTDFYVSTRESLDADWQPPVSLTEINTSGVESFSSVSGDGLMLFFSDHPYHLPGRLGGMGQADIYYSRRTSTSEPWGRPVNTGSPVNTSSHDYLPRISPDGSTLYIVSNRSGGYGGDDAWQSSIRPVVDFNSDGIVDIQDLVRLIEHWGQDNSTYDIGPMAWGDGVVDAADLEVLMSYWGQEVFDPHLLAHWALDEVEGMFAEESVSGEMDVVLGNPTWQPEGGQVGGCLEFDGLDDMVISKTVLDPANGPFSVFAWVRGGEPGQAILSQQTGVNWLEVNTDGTLMTELAPSRGRRPGSPLYSGTVITDGNWRHIGFVWDGAQRILYVDDVPVAIDEQTSLGGSTGGLVMGVGTDNQAGTFWSGMIDDVRIYSQAITP